MTEARTYSKFSFRKRSDEVRHCRPISCNRTTLISATAEKRDGCCQCGAPMKEYRRGYHADVTAMLAHCRTCALRTNTRARNLLLQLLNRLQEQEFCLEQNEMTSLDFPHQAVSFHSQEYAHSLAICKGCRGHTIGSIDGNTLNYDCLDVPGSKNGV